MGGLEIEIKIEIEVEGFSKPRVFFFLRNKASCCVNVVCFFWYGSEKSVVLLTAWW